MIIICSRSYIFPERYIFKGCHSTFYSELTNYCGFTQKWTVYLEIKFWVFNLFLHTPAVIKMHLQNQLTSKQYVKDRCMGRYSITIDGMWCYIYYYLNFNKRCRTETWNQTFQLLKLFYASSSKTQIFFFVVAFPWEITAIFYSES